MGCFFACFRIKDGQNSPLSSETTPCKSRNRLLARNQLASLLLSEEDGSPCEFDADQEAVERQLKHEGKFLKVYGTLAETPVEVKNEPRTIFDFHEDDEQPDAYNKKLQQEEKTNQISNISNSTASTPNFCLPDNRYHDCATVTEQIVARCLSSVHSAMYGPQNADVKSGNKPVWLKMTQDGSQCKSTLKSSSKDISPPQNSIQIQPHVSKDSPYPTPLKLIDGMETPGTLYPANLQNRGFAMNNHTRSQYAHPLQNCRVNISQGVEVSQVSHHPGQSGELFQREVTSAQFVVKRSELHHSLSFTTASSGFSQSHKVPLNCSHLNNEVFLMDTSGGKVGDKPVEDSLDDLQSGDLQQMDACPGSTTPMISSLSQWLKPLNSDEKRINRKIALRERSSASKSPETDRPIIGLVAARWNGEETTHVSPKLWDGNGIPNSTNKYKEDQRVNWHATPFEERLEKALSDEKLYPQRKLLNGKPVEFDEEDEESDTAAS